MRYRLRRWIGKGCFCESDTGKKQAVCGQNCQIKPVFEREKQEYVLSKQLLRSGTGIGANIREGTQAASRPDFVNKLSIALKESVETEYWLELLVETDYLTETEFQSIYADNQELTRLLTAIINTSKRNDQNTK